MLTSSKLEESREHAWTAGLNKSFSNTTRVKTRANQLFAQHVINYNQLINS